MPICGHFAVSHDQKLVAMRSSQGCAGRSQGLGPSHLGASRRFCQLQAKDPDNVQEHEAHGRPRAPARRRRRRGRRIRVHHDQHDRRRRSGRCRHRDDQRLRRLECPLHPGLDRPVDLVLRGLRPLGPCHPGAGQARRQLEQPAPEQRVDRLHRRARASSRPARRSTFTASSAASTRTSTRSRSQPPARPEAPPHTGGGSLIPPPRAGHRDLPPPHTPPTPPAPNDRASRRAGRSRCGLVLPRPARTRRRDVMGHHRRHQHAAAVPHGRPRPGAGRERLSRRRHRRLPQPSDPQDRPAPDRRHQPRPLHLQGRQQLVARSRARQPRAADRVAVGGGAGARWEAAVAGLAGHDGDHGRPRDPARVRRRGRTRAPAAQAPPRARAEVAARKDPCPTRHTSAARTARSPSRCSRSSGAQVSPSSRGARPAGGPCRRTCDTGSPDRSPTPPAPSRAPSTTRTRPRPGSRSSPVSPARCRCSSPTRCMRGSPHGLAGTASLSAVVSSQNGWTRTIPLDGPTPLCGRARRGRRSPPPAAAGAVPAARGDRHRTATARASPSRSFRRCTWAGRWPGSGSMPPTRPRSPSR